MKIILSESQISKLILEQRIKSSTNGYVVVRNIFLGSYPLSNNTILKGIGLQSNVKRNISIGLKNVSKDNSLLIIENVKFSKDNLVSDLKFKKEPFGSQENGVVNFEILPKNTTNEESIVSLSIYVDFVVANKNIRDRLEIKLFFRVKPQSIRLNRCRNKFNEKELKKAVSWIKGWLNNTSTKQRFIKTWKYNTDKTEKIFSEYNKILDQIKLEYVFSEKPNQGWVNTKGNIFQFYGLSKGGYGIPITINCSKNYEGPQDFFVHEIQHILDAYHKFYPYETNLLDDLKFSFSSQKNDSQPENTSEISYKLKNEGFDEYSFSEIERQYLWKLKKDELHLKNPNENMSNMWAVRQFLKLKPNEQITKKMLIDNYENDEVMHAICEWLYSKMDLQKWLDFRNSIALNQSKQNPNNNFV